MTNLETIDRHKYLYLEHIGEPQDGTLRLVVAEGRVLAGRATAVGPITECSPIVADDQSARYELIFDRYVAYAVRTESYAVVGQEERYSGRLGRVYSRSTFLDFVRSGTFASPDYPGAFEHYGVVCLNHVIDVASLEPPRVQVLGP
jgi:hypothetical protein